MSLEVFKTLVQGSPEWLAARCGLLTASTIGRLITPKLQVADNETSRGLTLTLAAERITGVVEYIHPTFDMQRGHDEEPIARSVYAEHFAEVAEIGFMTRSFDGFTLGFSPDGLVSREGLIEIKSRKPKAHLATILSGQPPADNMAQLMCGLLVSGRNWIDYVSFSGGFALWVKRVYADDAWFDAITAAAAAFEINVTASVATYHAATVGMPATERVEQYEEIELKL